MYLEGAYWNQIVRLSGHMAVCRRHGFRSVSKFALELQFVISCPYDYQRRHFQNDIVVAILDFYGFVDLNFSLALNINSKPQ